ncbi:phosphate signaling complex protein PhoU [Chordicoccus furentiruminis]|uniref:phosphate signaling complex protein PhoU n=1 Tax=Chordicoccus furentiruminis TaxID=2709410 RepID=UPI0023A7DB41|nr:phosphate signaling complex protein PhoU [Chordicoccus furentiruminis]
MRRTFDGQLKQLNNELVNMSTMVENAIERAVAALSKGDTKAAERIMEDDSSIDAEQKKIQDLCFDLLIQQQPVARDLRTITAAMNMVTDLERIGDHASDISEITELIANTSYQPHLTFISQMATETTSMLIRAIQSFVDHDQEEARKVIAYDDVIDELFLKARGQIVKQIREGAEDAEEAADLLMVAKYFERIGDHATNVAEWVIYANNDQREKETAV